MDTGIHGLKGVNKNPEALEVGECTLPFQGGRFRGTSVGRNKLGYFCFTHRAASKCFNKPSDITNGAITFIRSTG